MIGKLLGGRYELLEKIGGGGMAIVYKAKCHLLRRYVAVKVLRPEFVSDEEFVYRFKRESQAAASLSHQNIVNVYDVGQEDETYYIVMEYIRGQTLKDLIRENGSLSTARATNIAIQICRALEHAHNNNVVHRDIKPQNILVTDDGQVKVTDFGIARAITSSTVSIAGTSIIGSVHYFSPEQARGGYTDAKSDLYSLGIVLYEMLTGTVPFEGDSPISVALKHIQEEVKPPKLINPQIPGSLQDIILKAIQKDQDLRYTSAREMLEDLQRSLIEPNGNFVKMDMDYLQHTQVIPSINRYNKPDHNGNGPQKPQRRKRGWVRVLIILAVIIGIILVSAYIAKSIFDSYVEVQNTEVPRIVGRTPEEAEGILGSSKLKLRIEDRVHSDSVAEGHIISQLPKEGEVVKAGTTVDVVVSLGPEMVTVPDITSRSPEEARIMLEDVGLVLGKIDQRNDDEYPEGIIISQNPKKAVEVIVGTDVDIVVSLGPEIVDVTVVDFTEMPIETVEANLPSYNLAMGKVRYENSNTLPKGVVISHTPKANEKVPPGTKIDFVVSNGKPIVYSPKKLVIPLPQDIEVMEVVVTKLENEETTQVYSGTHQMGEESITIEIEGTGVAQFDILINGEVYHKPVIVDFTKKSKTDEVVEEAD
ncbi:MAG: Stk1 family PASTA domain-containing Ser/Thr kinase [Mahellales bacterium]